MTLGCPNVRYCCCVTAMLMVWSVTGSTASAQETSPESAPPAESSTGADSASTNTSPTASEEDKSTEPAEATENTTDKTSEATVTAEPPEEIPFKNLPYTVKVSVAVDNRCIKDQLQREELMKSLRDAVARMYGRMWRVDIEQNDWLAPATQRRLEWLETADVLERFPEEMYHKAFLVTVESSGSGYLLSCREYDSRIQELTPVFSRLTRDVRSIGTMVTELLRDTFRPSVLYVRGYENEDGRPMMEMQVQAGEIIPPDPSAEQVIEGDVLRPFVRQMNRRNPYKLDQLRRLDLSYVRVMEVDREFAPGRIQGFFISHSPFSPFGAKGRRIQHLAVRQRPSADHSKVRLLLQGRADKPLVSHRLAIAYQLYWKDPEQQPQTQLVSDRNGEVVIERSKDHPTFWIRVYSGASLLARVPYAPGLIPSDTIELPDDSVRLSVEGEIQLLSDELIDAIALGAVLMARLRKTAEQGDLSQFESLLTRYRDVPGKDYFLDKVRNIRIPAVNAAKSRRQRTTRIEQLCSGFESTVSTFFSDQKRSEQNVEIQQLKAVAESKSAAGG